MASQQSKATIDVIAHRGASGYLPEHTLDAKIMAHQMDVTYIEQDVVLSRDNAAVVFHDLVLDHITDVAEKFPKRHREDGHFYVIDFDLAELKTLKIGNRLDPKTGLRTFPKRPDAGETVYRIPSLYEEIQLIQQLNKKGEKNIGIYTEIKNPAFHKEAGKDISKIVLDILKEFGYQDKNDLCVLQCFDSTELLRIRNELGSELLLNQLVSLPVASNLTVYATYADYIGPSVHALSSMPLASSYIEKAHALGLKVHVYTLRSDDLRGFDSFEQQLEFCFDQLKVSGAFTDFPDTVMNWLRE